jgi:hypothetical protein
MILNLIFVKETALARLYENKGGARQWVPRSVCRRTLKFPAGTPGKTGGTPVPPVHEVDIADWWLEQNPFENRQEKLGI